MNLILSPIHLDTIYQLMDIAKKHDCQIYISVGQRHSPQKDEAEMAIWQYMEDYRGLTDELQMEISDYITTEDAYYLHDYVCFELIEKTANGQNIYHSMTYHVYDAAIYYKVSDYDRVFHSLSLRAEEWLVDNTYDGDSGIISIETTETIVQGFPDIETKVNVYREGMAVKNFGDLVCDYLHEPRIIKTY